MSVNTRSTGKEAQVGEVWVRCVECGQPLEEQDYELAWGGYYILVSPCETCMEDAKEE